MELNASHSKERAGLISTLRASSGLEIIIGADKVQRCQCQLLSGMHYKKQFKKPSDVGIILRDQIRSKWEKFIWHFGVLKELRLYKLYSVCLCVSPMCVSACVCAKKECRCVLPQEGEGMQAMRIMGKSLSHTHKKHTIGFRLKVGGLFFVFFFFFREGLCRTLRGINWNGFLKLSFYLCKWKVCVFTPHKSTTVNWLLLTTHENHEEEKLVGGGIFLISVSACQK